MEKVIIIKYAELSTKSDNINFFLKILKENVDKKLEDIEHNIRYDYGRMIVYTSQLELVKQKLQEVFGIHEICIGFIDPDKNIEKVMDNILFFLREKDFDTFKVVVKRSDKNYPGTSPQIAGNIGGFILNKLTGKSVDIHNPQLVINVEIRINEVLIYSSGFKGLGGYPVSALGKGLLMLSGGIDSSVAGYLAIKRGVRLEAIYFDSPPHTSYLALKKVTDLAKVLTKYNGNVRIHIINFTKIQEEIIKNIPSYYLITMMRRMMYEISSIVATKINAHAIINGECIGQVASQTLKSMQVINEAIKMPVLRPLCTYDKLEIIELSKKIGCYEISTLPYEDCCTIFVPKHPVIYPDLKLAKEYENLINKKELIYEAVANRKIVMISNKEEKTFQELL